MYICIIHVVHFVLLCPAKKSTFTFYILKNNNAFNLIKHSTIFSVFS